MTIRKANLEYMFELAGIQIEMWNAEMAGVCKGCTCAILGHTSGHITNLKAKYLDLNKMEDGQNM